jgi:hypothetical protein
MTASSTPRARRLRTTAVIVLVLGVAFAELIYWRGTRPTIDLSNDPSMLGNEKAAARQVQVLVGQQGLLVQEWTDDLKRPGVQATIMIVTAVLGAGACFYIARLMDRNA